MKNALLAVCFLCTEITLGQAEYSNWHFGNKAALTFTSGAVSGQATSSMVSVEACSSVSDHNGKLLFYSNGVSVYDRTHQLMANGSGLIGHVSTTQGALIVRQPGSANVYYLFTLGESGQGSLAYSKIDMSLAAGNGSVVIKNQVLAANMTEKMTGASHCNGEDVWVVTHRYHSDEFLSYLVTAAGVNTVPVVSAIGATHAPGPGQFDYNFGGAMKISPTGRKLGLVVGGYDKIVQLFDFSQSTGSISNVFSLDTLGGVYGTEFSPDGSKLYCTEPPFPGQARIFQWDLSLGNNTAIKISKQMVANPTFAQQAFLTALQVGADGRIYAASGPAGSDTISAIRYPNLPGSACGYTAHAVAISTGTCLGGLPTLVNTSFRQRAILNKQKLNGCATYTFSYSPYTYYAGINYSVQSAEWSFGDPNSSANTTTVTSPQHVFSANGKYAVKLVTRYQCFVDTITDTVLISDYPALVVTGKTTICKDDQLQLAASGASTYSWSPGFQGSAIALNVPTNTVLSVTGTASNNCASTASVTITVNACLGSPEQDEFTLFEIAPNPAQESLNISCKPGATIGFYDLLGVQKLVIRVEETSQAINITDLAAGVYLVRNMSTTARGKVLIKL
jgi:PKD repeat protein